jgi:hypothetical protein
LDSLDLLVSLFDVEQEISLGGLNLPLQGLHLLIEVDDELRLIADHLLQELVGALQLLYLRVVLFELLESTDFLLQLLLQVLPLLLDVLFILVVLHHPVLSYFQVVLEGLYLPLKVLFFVVEGGYTHALKFGGEEGMLLLSPQDGRQYAGVRHN